MHANKIICGLVATIFLTTTGRVDGVRILMTSPQMYSHVFVLASLGEELVRRRHEVYIVVESGFTKADSIERMGIRLIKYHVPDDVITLGSEAAQRERADFAFNGAGEDNLAQLRMLSRRANCDCELMYSDSRFMNEIRAMNFDLAVVEPFMLMPCSSLLPYLINVPSVVLSAHLFPSVARIPALPSFYTVPGAGSEVYFRMLTTLETLANTIGYVALDTHLIPSFWNATLLKMYAPEVPSWNDLILRAPLFLFDNSYLLNVPLPLFPNIITVAGITVRPARPLPDDLERIFEESPDGVILMSVGSIAHDMSADIAGKFLDAFSRLNQTIIAKFGVPKGMIVPRNVRILPWIPQNDILGHRRTLLFINHCGNGGQHEALYHGVPMLGFPLIGDQPYNCHRVVQKGFGLEMDVHRFTASELYDDIVELLTNDTYRKTIRKMSDAWREEPMIGREKAAFWIEHVIKYGGGHLRSTAMDLPVYRFYMLDVVAIVIVLIVLVILALFCLIAFMFSRMGKGFPETKKTL